MVLVELHVSGNAMDDADATALATALTVNTTLTAFTLFPQLTYELETSYTIQSLLLALFV
jgi:hypothetical protein